MAQLWGGLLTTAVFLLGPTLPLSARSRPELQRNGGPKVQHDHSPVRITPEKSGIMRQSSFTAAVYEHAVILPLWPHYTRQEALEAMSKNLNIYEEQVVSAVSQGADIIVFPEDGVYGMKMNRDKIKPFLECIPDPRLEDWNPCEDPRRYPNTDVQRRLSCMAKNNSIYIVANIGDRKPCNKSKDPNCPDDGQYQYNTDVVYSPQGALIARYHKQNLYNEQQFDRPTTPEQIFFDTHFGRFGMFTCFDILFRSPGVDLIENNNIDTILFPTAWMDALPFLAAIEYHSAYAVMMRVNLLAANIHLPIFRFGGSGIYTPVGAEAFYRNERTTKGRLIVATIPSTYHRQPRPRAHSITNTIGSDIVQNYRRFSQNNSCDFNTICEHFQSVVFHDIYNFVWLKGLSGSVKVCHGMACCYLDYKMRDTANSSGDSYFALGAFDGVHSDERPYYLQVCTLLKCANSRGSSCGELIQQSDTYFSSIVLKSVFDTRYVAPEILLMDKDHNLALTSGSWKYQHDAQELTAMDLALPVISVNLIGRWYSRDP